MGTHVRRSTNKWRERWIFADQWASEIRRYFFREMGILAKLLISPEKGVFIRYMLHVSTRMAQETRVNHPWTQHLVYIYTGCSAQG